MTSSLPRLHPFLYPFSSNNCRLGYGERGIYGVEFGMDYPRVQTTEYLIFLLTLEPYPTVSTVPTLGSVV